MLVGESLESAELAVIPEGTYLTLVDVDPEPFCMKVRLADGRAAFMTEETSRQTDELPQNQYGLPFPPTALEILIKGGEVI